MDRGVRVRGAGRDRGTGDGGQGGGGGEESDEWGVTSDGSAFALRGYGVTGKEKAEKRKVERGLSRSHGGAEGLKLNS